jgi:hypothetical protein
MQNTGFTENIEILKDVAEFTYKNLQRVLDLQTYHRKLFQWNDTTNKLEIDDSTYIKMKRLRLKQEVSDEWNLSNPLQRQENGEEEEHK